MICMWSMDPAPHSACFIGPHRIIFGNYQEIYCSFCSIKTATVIALFIIAS